MTRLTAMLIQTCDVEPVAFLQGDGGSAMWCGAVVYGPKHHHHGGILVSTQPIYDTGQEAAAVMRQLILDVRGLDLEAQP
jgi:hypothetical protein